MKISEYLDFIGLYNNNNTIDANKISEILEYIASLGEGEIYSNSENLAKLFCRTINKIDQQKSSDSINKLIIKAFENIKTMAIGNTDSSELKTIEFLQDLYLNRESNALGYDVKERENFNELIENLDKINIVFTLLDDKQKEYFPISKLISSILDRDFNKEDFNDVKMIQTLMLALQVFNISKNENELEQLEDFIDKYNLIFAKHLLNGYYRIGGDLWARNYEKNGVLILYNDYEKRVYIRNIEKTYFECDTVAGHSICKEKNNKGESIAYYVEFDEDISYFTNYFEELKDAKSKEEIDILLDIAINRNIYNVFIDRSLYMGNDGIVKAINPYTKNDKFIIVENKDLNSNFSNLCTQIKPLGLKYYIGKGINYIDIGMIYSLAKIKKFDISKFQFSNNSSYFNELLGGWIINCDKDLELFNSFLKIYDDNLDYLNDPKQLIEKQYNYEFFLPYKIDPDLLKLFKFWDLDINELEECNFKTDKYGELIITDVDGNLLSDFEIKNNSEIDLANVKNIFVLIDFDNKIIIVDDRINKIGLLHKKINKINKKTLELELMFGVKENDISTIKTYMELHLHSLQEIHKNMDLTSIVRYRLAHHIVANNFTKENFEKWIKLIKKHYKVDYSIIKSSEKFNPNKEGALYVLKDRSFRDSVFKDIYFKYIKNPSVRDMVDMYEYDPLLSIGSDEKILLNKNEIKEIFFVFDLILSGTATKRVLTQYLDPEFKTKYIDGYKDESNDNYNNRIVLRIKNDIIDINTILKTNTDVKVSVYAIYCDEVGKENVEEDLKSKGYLNEILYEKNIKNENKIDQEGINLIKEIYKYPTNRMPIRDGQSLIIREFSQPKCNIFSDEFLQASNICSLFVKRKEK